MAKKLSVAAKRLKVIPGNVMPLMQGKGYTVHANSDTAVYTVVGRKKETILQVKLKDIITAIRKY